MGTFPAPGAAKSPERTFSSTKLQLARVSGYKFPSGQLGNVLDHFYHKPRSWYLDYNFYNLGIRPHVERYCIGGSASLSRAAGYRYPNDTTEPNGRVDPQSRFFLSPLSCGAIRSSGRNGSNLSVLLFSFFVYMYFDVISRMKPLRWGEHH